MIRELFFLDRVKIFAHIIYSTVQCSYSYDILKLDIFIVFYVRVWERDVEARKLHSKR